MSFPQPVTQPRSVLHIIVLLALIVLLLITLSAVLASYFWSVTQT